MSPRISAATAANPVSEPAPDRASALSTVDDQLAPIRQELERQQIFRLEQLDELAADTAEAVALGDDGRQQVIRVLVLAAEAALTETSAALRRLEDGTYGTCEHCREPIPVGRLEVLPTSRLCTPCQSRAESRRR